MRAETYYDDGDFISQRRYKDGAYAIPYEGEEVKLHWANADQYYVKTSEYFKDYTFKTMYGDTVRFKLIEADTERDNNKANEKRFFQLYTDKPFEVIDDVLYIYIEYKNGSKKNQAQCTAEIVSAFMVMQNQPEYQPFSAILTITDSKTLLERQLNRYTARNSFDYFIHKDLCKFLRRELDFYIKNDVIYLDDIDEQDEAKTKEYLTKAKVIRKIAHKIIAFLAQIEDFQKKLYLKKKFVVETNYCITLDRVPEALYPEILANEAQREEWVRLFAIDEIEATEGDLVNAATVAYSVPLTIDFLKQNPFLVLDTAFFGKEFKEQLVDSIDVLDDKLDGLMIHSENSQALRLLSARCYQQIPFIYIDPPYNTDASAILYKNNYKDSSWLSLMNDRLAAAYGLIKRDGMICVAIDDEEVCGLRSILANYFEKQVGVITVRSNPAGRKTKGKFAPSHEYALFYGKSENSVPAALDKEEHTLRRFPKQDDKGRFAWANLIRSGTGDKRADRPTLFFPIYVSSDDSIRIPDMVFNTEKNEYTILEEPSAGEIAVYPIVVKNREQIEKRWQRGQDRISREPDEYRIRRGSNGEISIDFKTRMDEESLPITWWDDKRYASANYGAAELKELFNEKGFDFAKSKKLVADCITTGCISNDDTILDFFAGSGTTGHAVINLNREDNGNRKYILVEMGEYFNTVTKPRVQKVIYSMDTEVTKGWKDGKPISRKGTSHAFKYLRLESYEDTLNNIVLRSGEYDMFAEAQESYMLSYILSTEAAGSASLLNVEKLDKPFSYKMSIIRNLESTERTIDLVETFNYLIGLTVKKSHALVSYDSDFSTSEYGALSAVLKAGDAYKFKAVEGTVPSGDKTLVLWREMTGDIEKDNAALDAYFLSLPNARSFRRVYVNCDNNLLNLRENGESWQIVLIDEEMKKRMFENAE